MLGNVASDGLWARSRVPFQRTDRSVPRTGEQNRRVGSVLGGMGQRDTVDIAQDELGAGQRFGAGKADASGPARDQHARRNIVNGSVHERGATNRVDKLSDNNNRFRGPPAASRVICVDIVECTF